MSVAIFNPNVPVEDYHAPQVGVCSKSMLDLIARSPAHYYHAVTSPPKEPTAAMIFGTLAHSFVFEMAKCLASVVVQPDFGDRRTKANKERRDAWRLENDGKQAVSQTDWDTVRRIGDSIRQHPVAAKLIDQCQSEVSVFWQDPETGLECKARIDGWAESLNCIVDLKTTEDASADAFAASMAKYRYHVQEAHYSNGIAIVKGKPLKTFRFLAVEKTAPFALKMYVLGEPERARGHELLRRDIATMKRCVDSGEWPGYGLDTEVISFKPWHLRD